MNRSFYTAPSRKRRVSNPRRAPGRNFLRRPVLDVALQHFVLEVLLFEHCLGDVAERDHAEQAAVLHHREIARAALEHGAAQVVDLHLGRRGDRIAHHDIADSQLAEHAAARGERAQQLEAVAGSKPRRFSVSGTIAPEMPLAMHEPIMARNTTNASITGCADSWPVAVMNMPSPANSPTPAPLRQPSQASLVTRARSAPGLSSPRVRPRSVTASAWQPVLPDWPASTGRNNARITRRSMVSWKMPTTAAARNAVSRLSCSQGWRSLRLASHGAASRASFSTPTLLPACRALPTPRA